MIPFRPTLFVVAFLALSLLSTWGLGPVAISSGIGSLALYSAWLFQCQLVLKRQAESTGRQAKRANRSRRTLIAAAACVLAALVANLIVRSVGQVIGAIGAALLIFAIWDVAMDLRDAEATQQQKPRTGLGTFLLFFFVVFGAWEVRRRLRSVVPAETFPPSIDLGHSVGAEQP
jgi:hypothetical protein